MNGSERGNERQAFSLDQQDAGAPNEKFPETAASDAPPSQKTTGSLGDAGESTVAWTGSSVPGTIDSKMWREHNYEILETLGRGGMGVVYKARQTNLHRIVALKMILTGRDARDPEIIRFRAEGESLARLQHPHIVQIFDVGEIRGQPFVAIEYVEGGTLRKEMQGPPVALPRAVALAKTLSLAIHAAHEAGVVHRDLKPENVLLDTTGAPKITDFGLAKQLDVDLAQTATGAILGTPSYMSPEQARGLARQTGPATDVYALGAMLYEMLTGRPPFRGENALETLLQVIHEEPVAPRRLRPKLPKDLEAICLKSLEKKPANRYRSAASLAEDLARYEEGRPIKARRIGPLGKAARWARRRPAVSSLIVLAMIGTIAVAAISFWYPRRVAQLKTRGLIESLKTADSTDVPRLAGELAQRGEAALSELQEHFNSPTSPKERLNAALAISLGTSGQAPNAEIQDYLVEELFRAPAQHWTTVRDALHLNGPRLERVWEVAGSAEDANGQLRAACALATFDRDNDAWQAIRKTTVLHLLSVDMLSLGTFAEALRPVGPHLAVPLSELVTSGELDRSAISRAVRLLTEFGAGNAELLTEAITRVSPNEYAVLLPHVRSLGDQSAESLQRILQRKAETPSMPAPLEPAVASYREEFAKSQGMIESEFAFSPGIPAAEYQTLVPELAEHSYRPVRCRPYLVDGALFVSAVWTRDARKWSLALDEPQAKIQAMNRTLREQGFCTIDLSHYRNPEDPEGAMQYAAVWEKPTAPISSGLFLLSRDPNHPLTSTLHEKRFVMATARFTVDPVTDDKRYSSVWHQLPEWRSSTWAWAQTEPEFRALEGCGDVQVDVDVAFAADGTPCYTSVWQEIPDVVSTSLIGLAPGQHLEKARSLAGRGFRPVAMSAVTNAGQIVTASVWHRPGILFEDRLKLVRQKAAAAVTLAHLGYADAMWPLLVHSPDPELRSQIIHVASQLNLPAQLLVERFHNESEISRRRAILMSLGAYSPSQIPDADRAVLTQRLRELYANHPDPGLHSTIRWLFGKWALSLDDVVDTAERGRKKAPSDSGWFKLPIGLTMAVIPGPIESWMGAPASEKDRFVGEYRQKMRIPRSYAIATTEVTVQQFEQFLEEYPRAEPELLQATRPTPDRPITEITWFEALKFCRWLSDREGIPDENNCLPAIADIAPGMTLPPDFFQRSGYRLPTEAEWEYACRARADTSRYYGDSDDLLIHYAWFLPNSSYTPQPVGRLLPNEFGLFDTLGNVFEWCQTPALPRKLDRKTWVDDEVPSVEEKQGELLVFERRGGACSYDAPIIRAAMRNRLQPTGRGFVVGFRIARTIHESPQE